MLSLHTYVDTPAKSRVGGRNCGSQHIQERRTLFLIRLQHLFCQRKTDRILQLCLMQAY